MKIIKLGMIGFGNVGHGFIAALLEKSGYYKKELGLDFVITAITDIRFGTVYDPDGLPLNELADAHDFSGMDPKYLREWNTIETIREAECDVIIELSYTDLHTGEPAVLHCQEAILSGKHVITSNKGPIALYYKMLSGLARDNGVKIGYEATVMSGTPSLRLGREILLQTGIESVRGIFNGTTNFILTEMESGSSYEDALKKAQALGYAEADPTGDVEGFDCAGKVSILAQTLFGVFIKPDEISRQGITGITLEDIKEAKENGCRWKLIGSVKRTENGVETFVKPMMLPLDNPLANINGATNAIQYNSDLLGDVTLIGAGAGRKETAAALIEDLFSIYK